MDRAIYDHMAANDMRHWWYVARRKILERVIARQIPLPIDARILEIGCGTGHSLQMLSRFGRVDAVEMDAASRGIASQRLGKAVIDAKLPDLSGVPEGCYDLIALLDVVEHLDGPVQFVTLNATLKRHLKPGGRLLISVPAHQWMWGGHDVANHHTVRFSKAGLAELIDITGYAVETLTYFNSLLFPLAIARRLWSKLTKAEGSEDGLPPAPINWLFTKIFALEAHWVGRVPLPPGLSLLAIARLP